MTHDGVTPRGETVTTPLALGKRFLHDLLFRIAPARNDHQVAVRCGIGVFVPLMTLVAIDRLDLAIFASFGAFTNIYGRNEPHRQRVVTQTRAGLLMLCVLFAATVAARLSPGGRLDPWAIVAATSFVAWACSLIVGLWRLRPSGSLFQIFAFAAVASLPGQPPLGEAMLAALVSVLLGLLIGMASRVHPARRTPLTGAGVRAAWRVRLAAGERRALWHESWGYLVAAALAGTAATIVGQALGFGHNYWAMVAAVVPLVGHSTRHRLNRGLQRVLGTVVGLALLAAIVLLHPSPWMVVVLIAVCQFGAEMLIARQYFWAQVTITPLALMSTLLAAPANPGSLLHDRFIDTVIGALIGVLVVLAPGAWRRWRARPNRLTP